MKRILITMALLLPLWLAHGQQNITRGEYFIDADPGVGNGTAFVVPSPGKDVTLPFSIPLGALQPGFHKLNYRFKDASGKWGLTAGRFIIVIPETQALSQLTKAEYFVDNDPGLGNGTNMAISAPGANLSFTGQIPGNQFSSGLRTLNFRFRDESGNWSLSAGRMIFVEAQLQVPKIVYGEYFASPDPGMGNGISFSFSPSVSLNTDLPVSASLMQEGIQSLQFRFRDESGKWSLTGGRQVYIEKPDTVLQVVKGEYFIDKEPGFGKGIAFQISNPEQNITTNLALPAGIMSSNNFHLLHVRFLGKNGKWGLTHTRPVYISDGKEKYFTPINKIEYHVDQNTSQAALRLDSVGLAIHGTTLFSVQPILPVDTLEIGRHFMFVRGIDLFNNPSPVNDFRKFVVTSDTAKGMLLGVSLTPDSLPMTSGSVDVYQENAGALAFNRNIPLSPDGNFLSEGFAPGNYLLLLKPDIQAFPSAIDTYYDLAPQWEIGEILSINTDTMFNDVVIKALQTEVLGGTATLDGYITESSKKSGGIVKGPKITEGNPVKRAGVILVGRSKGGTSGTVLSKTVTDDLGHYSFQNIPLGSYDLLVDILGIPLVDYYTVEVVDQSANISNLNYLVGASGITIPSGIQKRSRLDVLVYPNPTQGELNILFQEDAGKVAIRLFDLSGRLVHTYEQDAVQGSVLSMNLGSSAKGWYTLVLTGASGTETRKLILQ